MNHFLLTKQRKKVNPSSYVHPKSVLHSYLFFLYAKDDEKKSFLCIQEKRISFIFLILLIHSALKKISTKNRKIFSVADNESKKSPFNKDFSSPRDFFFSFLLINFSLVSSRIFSFIISTASRGKKNCD